MDTKRSLLDERPVRTPVGGKIRTGIKVLKRSAANPLAHAIYKEGVAQGLGFDAIDKRIMTECKLDKSPLVPKNIPFFRVSPSDFKIPELADRIVDLYGEDMGEGDGRQLYRFPVVFAFDDWLQNMPHSMAAYGTSGLKFWSEYDAAGERFCMQYAPKTLDPANRRAARQFGGRLPMLRPENEGRCNPEQCREYQAKQCSLSARLLFYVPGIPGSSLIEMGTGSVYSMRQIKSQFDLVARIRSGRLSGTHGGEAIFWLTKVTDAVTKLDEAGQPVKVTQHLVHLEARIDMAGMMAGYERAALAAPKAVAILNGPQAQPAGAPEVIDVDPAEPPAEPNIPPSRVESAAGADASLPPALTTDDKAAVKALRAEVHALVVKNGADIEQFAAKMVKVHGEKWGHNAEALRGIKTALEAS